MIVAFDTSVLVPALVPALPEHGAAYTWIRAATEARFDGIMSWHAFAEAWSVLTHIPNLKPAPTPASARESLYSLGKIMRCCPLGASAYQAAVDRCSERGLRSGAIFDALHLICAEMEGAEILVTANVEHFQRLTVAAGPRIVLPATPLESVIKTRKMKRR